MLNKIFVLFILLGNYSKAQIIVSGYVKDKKSGEPLVGVSIGENNTKTFTITNNYGYYTLQIKPVIDSITVIYSSIGYKTQKSALKAATNKIINDISLVETTFELNSVTVSAEKQNNSERILGGIVFNTKQIKALPALLGEKDLIKAIQFLPGVQRGVEGSASLFVRGGNGDQNLLVLDDAVVYNANHFFGFFSVFNPDALKSVSFFNGGIPARYGGRLSSVIDIQFKEGNQQAFHGEGGIGIMSSRLTLEAPLKIKKKKGAYIISGRRTYFDPILTAISQNNSQILYKFYDINAKFNIEFSANDKLFVSMYTGLDELAIQENRNDNLVVSKYKTTTNWGNKTASIRWNHLFNQKLFLNNTISFTNYRTNNILTNFRQTNIDTLNQSQNLSTFIQDFNFKSDFEYFKNSNSQLKFGVQATFHQLIPRKLVALVNKKDIESTTKYENLEMAAYLENTYWLNKKTLFNFGFRLNNFFVYNKTYVLPEPRAIASYEARSGILMKLSYARTNQNISLLSNNGLGLSLDTWVPATDRFRPSQADIISIESSKFLQKLNLILTSGFYFKKLNNILSYKEGVKLVSVDENLGDFIWEDNVTQGKGISFGSEWGMKRTLGKLTGLASYTLSKTIHRFAELNQDKPFYPRQDIRHSFNIVGSYDLSRKVKIAASWIYTAGSPINIPQGSFQGLFADADEVNKLPRNIQPYFGFRNSSRTAPYHRLDVSLQLFKKKKRIESNWEFGIFNVYNRANPFYYFIAESQAITGKGIVTQVKNLSLLPILPSINYNFKF